MGKPAPAPWSQCHVETSGELGTVICDANGLEVAYVHANPANAHRIAAAPEMYEAGDEVLAAYIASGHSVNDRLTKAILKLAKALAKARGEDG